MNADLQIGFRRLGISKDDCIHPNWGCCKSPWVWVLGGVFFWPYCSSCGVLVPWRGTELGTMAVEVLSPSHWTTRELSKSKMFWHLVDNSLPWIRARLWRHTNIRPSFLQSRISKPPSTHDSQGTSAQTPHSLHWLSPSHSAGQTAVVYMPPERPFLTIRSYAKSMWWPIPFFSSTGV